jgi:hypothetical protein
MTYLPIRFLHVEDFGEELELGVGWHRVAVLVEIGEGGLMVLSGFAAPDGTFLFVKDSLAGVRV